MDEHALVFDEPLVDGEGEVLDVRGGGEEELFAFVVGDERLGEAGADGVDEDDVGEVEPGAGVVGEGGGVRGAVAGVAEGDVLGADGAEVEEAGGGAGAAVEGEHHGAVVCAVERVGGVDDFGGGLAVLALHGDGADGGGVVEGLAVNGDGLFDGLVGREWVGEGLGVLGWFGCAGRRCGRAGRGCGGGSLCRGSGGRGGWVVLIVALAALGGAGTGECRQSESEEDRRSDSAEGHASNANG